MDYNKRTNLMYFNTLAQPYWLDTKCYEKGTTITADRMYRLKNIALCTIGSQSLWLGSHFKLCQDLCIAWDLVVYHSDHYDGKDLTAFDSVPAVVAIQLKCNTLKECYDIVQALNDYGLADVLGEVMELTCSYCQAIGDRLSDNTVESLTMRLDEALHAVAPTLHIDVWGSFPFLP